MTEAVLEFFSGLPDWLYVLVISMLPIVELRGAIPVGAGLGMEYYLCYALAVFGNMLPVPFILLFIPRILDFMARFRIFRPIVAWLRRKADKHSKRVLKDGTGTSEDGNTLCSAELSPDQLSDTADQAEKTTEFKDLATDAVDKAEKAAESEDQATDAAGKAETTAESKDPATDAEIRPGEASDIQAASPKFATRPATCEKNAPILQEKRRVTRSLFIALVLFVAIPLPGTGAWTGGLVSSLFNFQLKKSALAIFLGVLTSGVIMSLISYGVLGFLSFLI